MSLSHILTYVAGLLGAKGRAASIAAENAAEGGSSASEGGVAGCALAARPASLEALEDPSLRAGRRPPPPQRTSSF